MKRVLFVILLLGLVISTAHGQQPVPVELEHHKATDAAQDDPLSGLDAYIRKSMAEWQIPGLAIAVVKDDQVVFIKGYGVREVRKDAPVNEQTVFPLSSMTKAFTAAAVGILVDEGKLSWDDPVIKHLPWFQLPDPWVTRQVTLRDLLAHRVGGDLGRHVGILSFVIPLDSHERLRRLHRLQVGEPRFRSRFAYRNVSFGAVGKLLEAVSGMSWNEFVKTRLLQPLDMTSATTSPGDLWDPADFQACTYCELPGRAVSFEDARIENIVMLHVLAEEGPRPVPWTGWFGRGSHPAGSISANVKDAAKWIRLQLAKGLYEGKRLLSAAVVEEMHTPQIPIQDEWYSLGAGSGHFWAYGLGWFLTDYRARKVVWHGGGFDSFIAMMPEEKLGVAVLSNLRGGPGNRANNLRVALPFWVFDAYLGAPKRDWSAEFLAKAKADRERSNEKVETQRKRGTQPSLPIESYTGAYAHPGLGQVNVTKEDGNLVLRFPGGGGGDLEHWHYDVFLLTWKGTFPIGDFVVFAIDPAGGVRELRIVFPPEPPAVFQRLSGDPQTE